MVDKNLFLYDLAIVAIFKNEARYLKEWIDYHLLAGVEHFYLYNNDSADDYKEILAPYIEKNLVTLTEFPGKIMQCPAYEDAIDKYRFESRYMAFIDCDEFIYPKVDTGGGIVEIVDEILSRDENAAGLAINWQCFGSNGHDKADYSRGVLERFTRRAPSDWSPNEMGNAHVKTISNPRLISCIFNPHFAVYFDKKFACNSSKGNVMDWKNYPILADKIVVNHYYIKSREEYFEKKMPKGWSCPGSAFYNEGHFNEHDRNEVFDDGILKYRAARAEKFSFESDNDRINRVINALFKTLTEYSSTGFFVGKLEIFLTCRAAAEKFQIKIYGESAEEISLVLIYQILKGNPPTYAEMQMFLKALPKILSRPFPICKEIKDFTQNVVLPTFCKALNTGTFYHAVSAWMARSELQYIQQMLSLIKL